MATQLLMILGGWNDEQGNLSEVSIARLDKAVALFQQAIDQVITSAGIDYLTGPINPMLGI